MQHAEERSQSKGPEEAMDEEKVERKRDRRADETRRLHSKGDNARTQVKIKEAT